jgi:uncharacterized repeat protein (TIGR02543 family)
MRRLKVFIMFLIAAIWLTSVPVYAADESPTDPVDYPVIEDAYVRKSRSTTNYSFENITSAHGSQYVGQGITVINAKYDGTEDIIAAMKFKLPTKAEIEEKELNHFYFVFSIFKNAGYKNGNQSFIFHYSTDTSWSETSLTWNNKPSYMERNDSHHLFQFNISQNDEYEFKTDSEKKITTDISNTIMSLVDQGYEEITVFATALNSLNHSITIYSKETSEAAKAPKIVGSKNVIDVSEPVDPTDPGTGLDAPIIYGTQEHPLPENATFDVYLAIGQSNMSGRGFIEEQDQFRIPNTLLWNGAEWESAQPYYDNARNQWWGLNRYDNQNEAANDKGRLNPAFYFADDMQKANPGRTIGIISDALGGTTLKQWTKGDAKGLYANAVTQTKAALAAGGTLKGILWHQGEYDLNGGTHTTYITRLNALVDDIRMELDVTAEDVPFIAGEIPRNHVYTGNRSASLFNDLLPQFVSMERNTDFISSEGVQDGGRTGTDTIHFSAAGQRELGHRYAAKMLAMQTAVQDNSSIAAAKNLIEAATYTATQADVADAAAAKANVEAIIDDQNLNGVTATVLAETFTAAQSGTAADINGVNGSYSFTVELAKGAGANQTTSELTLTITATPYIPEPSEEYTVTFNSDGGNAVAEVKVKKGEKVVRPADPIKEGYTFEGWFNGEQLYSFDTEVTTDLTLTAKWTRNVEPYIPSKPAEESSIGDITTVTNEDGSNTKNVTDKKTGSVTVTTTRKDGTVIKTTTPKDGIATSDVSIPGNVDSVTVIIPTAKRIKAGEVAVIVKPDGTREIIRNSFATEEGMQITLAESARIEIIDNTKAFIDVPDSHWANASVTFIASRELMSVTDENIFAPTGDMTRAMLVTVLARLDGQDTEQAERWDSVGTEWGTRNGITDGTNMTGSITREQLVVMLYRYAKAKKTEADLTKFADADKVSGWAAEAMNWAVSVGILTGKKGGLLDPQGNAGRAEVATMLERFIKR